MFSTVAFAVAGVAAVLGAIVVYNPNSYSRTGSDTMFALILVGLAIQMFIGAELSSIWRRTAEAAESTAESLKEQTELLRGLAAGIPNAATEVAASEEEDRDGHA